MATEWEFFAAAAIVLGLLLTIRLWERRENARREPSAHVLLLPFLALSGIIPGISLFLAHEARAAQATPSGILTSRGSQGRWPFWSGQR